MTSYSCCRLAPPSVLHLELEAAEGAHALEGRRQEGDRPWRSEMAPSGPRRRSTTDRSGVRLRPCAREIGFRLTKMIPRFGLAAAEAEAADANIALAIVRLSRASDGLRPCPARASV